MRLFAQPYKFIAEVRSWLRAATQRRRLEREMEAELENHTILRTEELIGKGHSPEEAARRARIELGTVLTAKEGMRASLGLRWVDELAADLRLATRLLRKSPSFTAIAAGSLALAIGANTIIFTVGKELLFARLHVLQPEQLRLLRLITGQKSPIHNLWGDFERAPNGEGTLTSSFSYPVYEQMRAHNQVMQDLFAFKEDSMNATAAGTAQRVDVSMVSGNFYQALGVQPQWGRPIQPSDDDTPGSGTVAVISDSLWQRAFNRSPAVLGQTIKLNQSVMTIVGVNPRGFTGAKGVLASPDIFVPMSMMSVLDTQPGRKIQILEDPQFWWVNVMGRIKPDVAEETARAALDVQLSAAVRSTLTVASDEAMPRLLLEDGSRGMHWMDRMVKKPIYVLAVITSFVLLLACANVANLVLARGAQRQREVSVRLALGASRMRILRQLLTESLLLAAMGGAGGLALAYLGRNLLPNLLFNNWEGPPLRMPFDWGAFAFTALVTLCTGALFGLLPAWLAARSEVSTSLKESARQTTRRRRGLGGKAIVGFQVALSTLLVIGAGLFLRSLWMLSEVDTGFNTNHLLLAEVNQPRSRYPGAKGAELHAQLEKRIAAIPGVERVTEAAIPYLAGMMNNAGFLPEGGAKSEKEQAEDYNVVGNDFFAALGIPIVAGRGFGLEDTATSQRVAVINQTLAHTRFPGVNPIGRRFRTGDKDPWIQIVGICRDTRYYTLRDDPPGQFFEPFVQQGELGGMTYELRTHLAPAAIVPSLRRVVQSVDRDLPVVNVRTQRQQIDSSNQIERAFAALTAGFGVLALALACVGVYGVMAYSVTQRTNEIGIRLALGAVPAQVRMMVLRESTWIAVVGIAVGLGSAFALTRLVKSMLYGVTPNDPLTIAAGVAVLLLVALVSSWIPARRAASVQPMDALRHE